MEHLSQKNDVVDWKYKAFIKMHMEWNYKCNGEKHQWRWLGLQYMLQRYHRNSHMVNTLEVNYNATTHQWALIEILSPNIMY